MGANTITDRTSEIENTAVLRPYPAESIDRGGRDRLSEWRALRWAAVLGRSRLLSGWQGAALTSLAASVLSWQTRVWRPVFANLDPSWQAALALGFVRHLQWGPSLIFTFGPYGFTDYIINFYRLTALIAVVFALAVTWGLAALIVSALRPSWGLLPAGIAAWTACALCSVVMGYADLEVGTALGLALTVLRTEQVARRLVLLALLGGLTGFQLLSKFNEGLVTVGLLLVSVAFCVDNRGRCSLVGGTSMIGVTVTAWVAAGQSLSHFPSYLRGSLSVAIGYGAAMQWPAPQRQVGLAVVMVALLAAVFLVALRGRPHREQAGTVIVLVGWGWAVLREGFVRAAAHEAIFFGLVIAALGLARVRRRLVPVQVVAIALSAVVALYSAGARPIIGLPEEVHSPLAGADSFVNDLVDTLLPGSFVHVHPTARAEFAATGGALAPATLSLLEGHTVAVEPTEDSIIYSYPQLRWDPEPVLQGYSAYTPYLDQLNATFLASAKAPQRILYQTSWFIDGRDTYFDPPSTLASMYCHYVQVSAARTWQVLAHVPDRCGPAVEIGRASAHFGQPITVPQAPGKLVLATFTLATPLEAKLMGLALKPPMTTVKLWAKSARSTTYRFIPGTAQDDHVLSAPVSLGYSPRFTPPTVRRIEFSGDGWVSGTGKVFASFYAVTLARR